MKTEKLKNIFSQFQGDGKFESHQELVSGHINDTYLIKTKEKPNFVLQRVNNTVFTDVPGLIENKVRISAHIREKLKHLPEEERNRRVLTFVKTKKGSTYFKDEESNYWNLMYFIDNSVTFEMVKDEEVAYEGGKLFGEFLNFTSDFNAERLTEVIPKFHDMSYRYLQFQQALQSASKERLEKAKRYLTFVAEHTEEMHQIQNLKNAGKIRLRVTHNDTKISNALFTKDKKGLCVIDTDTIMPGIIHYDFGDAVRTICNTATEDETNLELVHFNTAYYKAYTKGFLEKTAASLSPIELKYLPLSVKTMIFIMALRFLTDYLNNDTYYKTRYAVHNLDRAKNQFKLIESFTDQVRVF
jgi:mRNA-degrading endonuclease RelE of RelBE toxin-antitoxin system